jgi:sn-glycerol 3-phosphate transport system ATP-binding protein
MMFQAVPTVPVDLMSDQAGLTLDAVARRFDAVSAVDDLSVRLPAGQFSVLLGPSGCGKSTLLRMIAGLDRPTSGRIVLNGRDVTGLAPSERDVSMVFQSYALFPHLDVAANILFGLSVRRVPKAEQRARLDRVAAMMGLSELLRRRPAQLSGGQQQRVALARAVISERPVCLMDEPLSNLDAKLRAEMRVEIRALQQRLGLTMVYVTHDQVEAMTMADRIVVMNQGRMQQVASPRDLYAAPANTFVARFIGTPPMNLIPAAALSGHMALPPRQAAAGCRADQYRGNPVAGATGTGGAGLAASDGHAARPCKSLGMTRARMISPHEHPIWRIWRTHTAKR